MRKKEEVIQVQGFWLNNPVLHLKCPKCACWAVYSDHKSIIPLGGSFKGKINCAICETNFSVEISEIEKKV